MGVTFEGVQRQHGVGVASYLPSVRARFEFSPDALGQVQRWRGMGASWQAIARNFGCCEDKVRRAFDPTYVPAHVGSTMAQAAVEAQTVRRVAMGSFQHEALKLVAHGPKSAADLAQALDCRRDDVARVTRSLLSKELITPFGEDAMQLTAAGLGELDRLRDVVARREPDARDETAREARRRRILLALLDGFDTTCAIARRIGLSDVMTKIALMGMSAAGEVASERLGSRGARWTLTAKGTARAEALSRG